MQIRQGDVLLVKIDKLPDGDMMRVEPEGSRLILVRGEATGHHHSVDAKRAFLVVINTAMYLRVLRETVLKHQEHEPVPLPPCDYQVIRQREYTPQEIRNVTD